MTLVKQGNVILISDWKFKKVTRNKVRWDAETPPCSEPLYFHRDNMPDWAEFDEDGMLTNGELTEVGYKFTQYSDPSESSD